MNISSSAIPQSSVLNRCNFPPGARYGPSHFLGESELKRYRFLSSLNGSLFKWKTILTIILCLTLFFGGLTYANARRDEIADILWFFKYLFIPFSIIVIILYVIDSFVYKEMMKIAKKATSPCLNAFNKVV
jgi:predicted membrane protein